MFLVLEPFDKHFTCSVYRLNLFFSSDFYRLLKFCLLISFQYESSGDPDEHDDDYEDEFDEESGGKNCKSKETLF